MRTFLMNLERVIAGVPSLQVLGKTLATGCSTICKCTQALFTELECLLVVSV